MTIIDCCISLKMIKKNLVVLGVVDMRQLLLTPKLLSSNRENVLIAILIYKDFIIGSVLFSRMYGNRERIIEPIS